MSRAMGFPQGQGPRHGVKAGYKDRGYEQDVKWVTGAYTYVCMWKICFCVLIVAPTRIVARRAPPSFLD